MEEECTFDKMCRVCLTEEGDMVSLLTGCAKMQTDDSSKLVMLDDILSYVINSEVFFMNGPYLICNNCVAEACAAYKFKKRCEEALTLLTDCGLTSCQKEEFAQSKRVSLSDLGISRSRNNTNFNDVIDANFEVDLIKGEDSYDEITIEEVDIEKSIKEESFLDEHHLLCDTKGENSMCGNKLTASEKDNLQNISARKISVKISDKILCSICGFKKSRSGFHQHMLRHTGEKRHLCPFCQRRFNDKCNMKVHIRTHTGNFPYSCDVCSKRFNHATNLKIHKRIHDGVKPYKCHICTYCARTNSHLQVHINRHIGIKNYHCAQCEYSAYSKQELKDHLTRHSNNKCYICKICSKAFARHKNLKIHEQSHTGEKATCL